MKIKPSEITGLLARRPLPSVVLLHGSDQGLVDACAGAIQQKLLGVDPDVDAVAFDVERFHAADLVLERLQVAYETRPFFIKRRLVVVREGQQLPAAVRQGISGWLAQPNFPVDNLLLLLASESLEARDPLRRFCEAHPTAWCVAFYPLEGVGWRQWIQQHLGQVGMTVTAEALAYLADYLAGDTQSALNELDKLDLYLGTKRQADLADVLAVVGETVEFSGHAWAAALLGRDRTQTLRILERLLESGQEPLMLLGGLVRRLWQMVRLQSLLARGVPQTKALAEVQVFWKDQQSYIDQLRNWPEPVLAEALMACCDADTALKGGSEPIRPASEVLGQLVLRLVSQPKVSAP
ncbi:MAG: DNA polymerase III subunit delta [Magnetococcales bacterium]|nr:DNA polymerase III subunit delta [Magnetococcales bacterium]